MSDSLLRQSILRLRLDLNAPYPYELLRDEEKAREAREEIKRFRESQRLHLVTDEDAKRD